MLLYRQVIFLLSVCCQWSFSFPVSHDSFDLNAIAVSDSDQDGNQGSPTHYDIKQEPSSDTVSNHVKQTTRDVAPVSQDRRLLPRPGTLQWAQEVTVSNLSKRVDVLLKKLGSNIDASGAASSSPIASELSTEDWAETEILKKKLHDTIIKMRTKPAPEFKACIDTLQGMLDKLPKGRRRLDPADARERSLKSKRVAGARVRLRKKVGLAAVPYLKRGKEVNVDNPPPAVLARRVRQNSYTAKRRQLGYQPKRRGSKVASTS